LRAETIFGVHYTLQKGAIAIVPSPHLATKPPTNLPTSQPTSQAGQPAILEY
jgi:hypothetical protein